MKEAIFSYFRLFWLVSIKKIQALSNLSNLRRAFFPVWCQAINGKCDLFESDQKSIRKS